jgi:hypothetical protein
MKQTLLFAAAVASLGAAPAHATLSMWQAEVAAGTAPAATQFTAITAPILFDIGALSGDRSLEFIFNGNAAAEGSVSSALIGTQSVADGRQGLKYEQWNNTGFFGATAFGVADYTSTVPVQDNVTLHAVFTSNGTTTTDFYLNGALVYTFDSLALALTGVQGLGAASTADGTAFFDVLPGTMYGFASYDSALSPAEISSHFAAFTAIPEPGSAALAALAGIACLGRRRRGRA